MISKTIMILAIAAAFVAGTLTTATIVTAQVDTIQACVDTKKGVVRIVSSAADCDPSKETPIQWNAQGPTGPPGADGQDGAPGADGQDGADGLTPIFQSLDVPDICPGGAGFQLIFGFDLNGNGVLDKVAPGETPEILGIETICNGGQGPAGADGSSCSISGSIVSCTDGTSSDVEGPQGPAGVDTLGGLTCIDGQTAKWNGMSWECANDNDTTIGSLGREIYTVSSLCEGHGDVTFGPLCRTESCVVLGTGGHLDCDGTCILSPSILCPNNLIGHVVAP